MTLLQCAVKNWGGLLILRLLMGAFEAGFFAGISTLFSLPVAILVEPIANLNVDRCYILPHSFL